MVVSAAGAGANRGRARRAASMASRRGAPRAFFRGLPDPETRSECHTITFPKR
jgi:hypothetical protein